LSAAVNVALCIQTTSTGLRALLPKSSVKKAAEPSDHAVTAAATGGGSKRVAAEKKEVESEEKQVSCAIVIIRHCT
jgi:hypothetical protein